MLDVGAGDGTLIDALRALGREATGLERNPARDDLSDEPLEEVKGEWAAVVFWHSLEHLPSPGDAIRQAARLLLPGGVVVIAVPNNRQRAGAGLRRPVAAPRHAAPPRPPLDGEPSSRTA